MAVALVPMDRIPAPPRSFDLVVAHGIRNLAWAGVESLRAVSETGAWCIQEASLFVSTFSRNTLPDETQPVRGETFVFTEFLGRP